MKTLIFLIGLFSSILHARDLDFSLIKNSQGIPKTNLDYPENLGDYYFGTGFNSFSGRVAGTCVSFGQIQPLGNGKSVVLETQIINTQSDLNKALNIEVSAGIRYGLSGLGAKVKFANEITVNDFNFFLLAKVEVLGPESITKEETLSKGALDILRSNNKEAFLNKCGNEFVKGINQGSSLYAIFEIKFNSSEEKINFSSQLKGNIGIFSTEAGFSKSLTQLIRNHQTKFKYIQSGGVIGAKFKEELRLPQEQEEVVNYITTFASKVTEQNMVPLKARTAGYGELMPIEFLSSPAISQQVDVLNFLENKRVHYLHALANYEYIIRNSKDYLPMEELSTIFKEREKVMELINKTATLADKCAQDMAACFFPAELIEFSVKPPHEMFRPICEFKEVPICGIASSELINNGEICGFSKDSIRDESCGVASYKEGRGKVCLKNDFNDSDVIYKMGSGPQCGVALYHERRSGTCGWIGNGWLGKLRAKTCRHFSFGVEKYNSCRHKDFDVEIFPLCRNINFGVETFNSCPVLKSKTCEIKKYKSCWVTFSQTLKKFEFCPLFAIPQGEENTL